jgi:cell division protein FtsI (penicillin-binding protein 3)
LLIGVAIIAKVVYIQYFEGPELIKKAQRQELAYFTIDAVRGNIYSDNGSLLATSVPIFDVRMDVASPLISQELFNQKVDSLAYRFALLFGDRSRGDYKISLLNARKKGNRYHLIKRNVTYAQLKEIRKFPILRRGKYRGGLITIPKTTRKMPFSLLAKRTIGYEIKKENLFVGLEGAYGEVLRGTNGKQLMRRLSYGDWKPVYDENQVEPENGKDILTTIDINIQDVAEHALLKNLIKHEAFQGCVVLMEVETGHVKAIANLNYNEKTGRYEERYNYAIGVSVEPGSTFKLASMLALLEDKKVNLTDTIDVGDGWTMFHDRTMQDVKKIRDGRITIREAFEKSSNVGISTIVVAAYEDNPRKFVNRLHELKLHEKLGIEIKGEGKPVIKDPGNRDQWYGTTLPWMSIGYSVSLTPLQTLTLYNAIANDGRMVKPMFVREVQQSGQCIEEFETEIRNRKICSKSTLDSLKSLLEGVVVRGTAQNIKNRLYKIAGKTGTAQIADDNKGYDDKVYNSSFVGYFPADDPKYSCIVVINAPKKGYYYGSSVAAPVFKEVADKVFAMHLDIPVDPPTEEQYAATPGMFIGYHEDIQDICNYLEIPVDTSSSHTTWVVTQDNGQNIKFLPRYERQEVVPNVKGMGARDAIFLLEKLGLKTKLQGRGIIINQSIKPGTKVIRGNEIILKMGLS